MATLTFPTLLTSEEAAEVLGIKPGTLEVWRCTHRYPLPYVKVGRSVRYRPDDLEQFLRERTVHAGDAE